MSEQTTMRRVARRYARHLAAQPTGPAAAGLGPPADTIGVRAPPAPMQRPRSAPEIAGGSGSGAAPRARVFISHAQEDRPLAMLVRGMLESRGGWQILDDLGSTDREAAMRRLTAAEAIVVVWTPQSIQSPVVQTEAAWALTTGRLVAVRTSSAPLPPPFDKVAGTDIGDFERIRSEIEVTVTRSRVRAAAEVMADADSASSLSVLPQDAAADTRVPASNTSTDIDFPLSENIGRFTIALPPDTQFTGDDPVSTSIEAITKAIASVVTDPGRRDELAKTLFKELYGGPSTEDARKAAAAAPSVVFYAGKIRHHLRDAKDGFRARRQAYRKEYRHFAPNYERVKSRSVEDYTVVDFLNEEWGDLIRAGSLTSAILNQNDSALYMAIRHYARGLREGTFGRPPRPEASIEELLRTPKISVRVNPGWRRNAEDTRARRPRSLRSSPRGDSLDV